MTHAPPQIESDPSERSAAAPNRPPLDRDYYVSSPVGYLAALGVGFVLGVFLMVTLRSELRRISELQGKMAVFLGAVIAVGLFIYPAYRRLRRGLRAAFGPERGATILYLVHFLLLGGGLVLFTLAGLYFIAVS